MIHQWNPQRFRYRQDGRRIGTIETGTIVYIQDGIRPFGQDRHWGPVRRNPWIVEAWQNRDGDDIHGVRAGGHLAVVRSLRDGRRATVADWIIRRSLGDD